MFMVDATDKDRFSEARDELNKLLLMEDLKNIPLLVLGNKIDR